MVRGLVRAVPPSRTGKSVWMYAAANRYCKGEAFPKREREKREEEPEEPEELSELEIERQRNIERNHAILRQLGLL